MLIGKFMVDLLHTGMSKLNYCRAFASLESASTDSVLVCDMLTISRLSKNTYEGLTYQVAGGFFTTKYNGRTEGVEDGSRFDPNKAQGKVRRSDMRAQRVFHPDQNILVELQAKVRRGKPLP